MKQAIKEIEVNSKIKIEYYGKNRNQIKKEIKEIWKEDKELSYLTWLQEMGTIRELFEEEKMNNIYNRNYINDIEVIRKVKVEDNLYMWEYHMKRIEEMEGK